MAKQTKYDKQFSLDMSFEEALQRFSKVNTKDLSSVESEEAEDSNIATPFLKWVGGKRSIIGELKNRMPKEFNDYYECFIGGGALYFASHKTLTRAYLSDANLDLVITFNVVKKSPDELIELLKKHQRLHCKEYYYRLRSKHDLENPVEVAARMIYLNKTCFNGLWRVNKSGEFNVPMGSYTNPGICQEDNIRECSKALKKAVIEYRDYSTINAKEGDFVYLDPPYHPTSDTASFTSYAKLDFTEKDQMDLQKFCLELHRRGTKIMLSNSNTPLIRDLYKSQPFKIGIVNAPRLVNCKASGRNAVEEVLITNY